MPPSRSRYAIDTNVLIDFHKGGLLEQLFTLEAEFCTTDFVFAEQFDPSGDLLHSYGLQVMSLLPEQVVEIVELRREAKRTSVQDLSTFVLARDMGICLLTGDGALRALARRRAVEVHGTLWLLDMIVEQGVVESACAASALEAMMENGRRLPEAECRERLSRWGQK